MSEPEITVGSRWKSNDGKIVVRAIEQGSISYWSETHKFFYATTETTFREHFKPLPTIDGPGWYLRRDGYPAYVVGKRPLCDSWVVEYRGGFSVNYESSGVGFSFEPIIGHWTGEPPKSFDERRV